MKRNQGFGQNFPGKNHATYKDVVMFKNMQAIRVTAEVGKLAAGLDKSSSLDKRRPQLIEKSKGAPTSINSSGSSLSSQGSADSVLVNHRIGEVGAVRRVEYDKRDSESEE